MHKVLILLKISVFLSLLVFTNAHALELLVNGKIVITKDEIIINRHILSAKTAAF